MEAGTIFYSAIPRNPKHSRPRYTPNFPRFLRASANPQSQFAIESEAVTNILTGLVWLSIRPKSITVVRAQIMLSSRSLSITHAYIEANREATKMSCLLYWALIFSTREISMMKIKFLILFQVNPEGVECWTICSHLPDLVVSELLWAWESLSAVTCCRSLVVVYDGVCVLQIGKAADSGNDGQAVTVDAGKLMQGSVYQGLMRSGAQSYLANLLLYPGRSELPFLPSNTQAVILQPLGDNGIAIVGRDTSRGFTTSDQSWIAFIGEKLDATLTKYSNTVPLVVQDGI